MRNIVSKVVRKYFCRDASNPSEPAGRNTSDSELEKRVRPREERENPTAVEKLNSQLLHPIPTYVQSKPYPTVSSNM